MLNSAEWGERQLVWNENEALLFEVEEGIEQRRDKKHYGVLNELFKHHSKLRSVDED
jgi:hypothetical protein